MLLFEAKREFDERLEYCAEIKTNIPEYMEAMEIASKCIASQIRLSEILNDWDGKEDDSYSDSIVKDILEQLRFDYEEELDE